MKWKGGWSCAWMGCGGPSVTMLGQTSMQLLCVTSWVILELVSLVSIVISVCLSACLSYFLSVCLHACLIFCLSVCMPVLFSVCLSVSGKCHLYSAGLVDARSRRRAAFGQGTGAIHLDTFYCFGEEDRITDCIHRRATQCTHAQDAGVVCTAGTCTVH